MANNGPGVPAGVLDAGVVMISGGEIHTNDGFARYSFAGSVQGLTRFTMALAVFGDSDPVTFLAALTKALVEKRSGLKLP